MESVEVYFMLKRTLPDYQVARPQKVLLCAECAGRQEGMEATIIASNRKATPCHHSNPRTARPSTDGNYGVGSRSHTDSAVVTVTPAD